MSPISSDLARDTAKVNRVVDSMTQRIDRMVVAVCREDWNTIGKISHRLAKKARVRGYRAISALAESVYAEAAKNGNVVAIKRSVIRLVGAHGRMPRRADR